MVKLVIAIILMYSLAHSAETARVDIICNGTYKKTDVGYECTPLPGIPPFDNTTPVGVEIRAETGINFIITRRLTDNSKTVRIELPKSMPIKINGVSK